MSDDRQTLHPLCRWMFPILLLVVSLAPGVRAQGISDSALAQIDFVQNLGAQVPGDLRFQDETGRTVRLGGYFGSKPLILVLGYYGCPMLCTYVLNGLVEGLQDLKWHIGAEFDVINVSINPQEGPTLAAAKKQTYLKRYGRSGAVGGWHFLTGEEPEIRALAQTVGFGYRFDPATQQYAHPSGVVILTPQGKVAKYMFGVTFASRDLYESLRTAGGNQISSPVQRLILLCFHYNPLTGKYSANIMTLIRIFSVATVFGLAGLMISAARRPKPS
jgi:protein SCO1/2